jgi:type III secretion protein J
MRLLALAALLACTAACERVTVQGGLEERAANEIALLLEEGGVASRKEPEAVAGGGEGRRWALTIAAADSGRAFQLLADQGLPRVTPPGFDEVLGAQSLIPTAGEERARHTQALSGELVRTLESIRGVLEARVHLALPEPSLLETAESAARAPTASVLLKTAGPAPPLPVEDIRRLVSGAVQGLQPASVSVVVISQPAPPRPASDGLVSIAGVRVSPSSAGSLRALLGAALGLDVVLAGGLIIMALRRRSLLLRQTKEPA